MHEKLVVDVQLLAFKSRRRLRSYLQFTAANSGMHCTAAFKSKHVIDICKHQCVQEWSQYYEKRFDGLFMD